MRTPHALHFAPFRLELASEQLWRGAEALRLTPKAWAVLRYLVEHAGQLVTKEALIDTVWADIHVSDAALAVCIHELRRALGDQARSPRFIETVHRRGYRFIAPVISSPSAPSQTEGEAFASLSVPGVPFTFVPERHATRLPASRQAVPLLGREAELSHLHQGFELVLQGERLVVFITGEPGIGKTTLVEAFVAQVEVEAPLWLGYGQCVEQYGAGEAYLPLLEALGRLCRGTDGPHLITLLAQHAPSWLVQMPALLSAAERETLQRQASGATRERMLRELAEAVDVLTKERPLVLVLEDLHWCDHSTLAWLSFVARHRGAARLLILGTYRPVEAIVHDHPLRRVTQELQGQGLCVAMMLDYLSEASVAAYLSMRFGSQQLPDNLSPILYQRTNGNPLFLSTMADALVRQGILREDETGWHLLGGLEALEAGVPESLRQLIEQQLAHLHPEQQRILETASVAGLGFASSALAAGAELDEEEVEAQCALLTRQGQFVQELGPVTWPDGTISTRYGFIHALYQEVLYTQVPAGRRARLHHQIGDRLEATYGAEVREIATELAVHFTRGRATPRAVQYLLYAGENARQRSAYEAAIQHFTNGLDLLVTLPAAPERTQQKLDCYIAFGASHMALRGYGAPEVAHAYRQARELCSQVGETPQLLPVLHGLWSFYVVHETLTQARELGDQCLTYARRRGDPSAQVVAHWELGANLFFMGEGVLAREHFDQVMYFYETEQSNALVALYRQDPSVTCLSWASLVDWYLGYPDQALARSHQALTAARKLGHPFSLAFALALATRLHQLCRTWHRVEEHAEATLALASEQGFTFFVAWATRMQGRALIERGQIKQGIRLLGDGLDTDPKTPGSLFQPYWFALLAEGYGRAEQTVEGLSLLTQALALANASEERWYEAELHRLQGELLGRQTPSDPLQAEACFHRAHGVARSQLAKSWELRAATSLARLWQQQGKQSEARELLAPVYEWFTEGFDTADLKDAAVLLEALHI